MSNYHVKEITADGRKARVVFHIPIPVENNSAGVDLRTAVSQYIDSASFTSKVPWITIELVQLQSGELYEHLEVITFESAATALEKQTEIDNRYTALSSSVLNKMREVLKFWGKDRDII